MNTWSGFLCVILVAGPLVGPASAQSMFHFPQVEAGGPGTLTVANVEARAAEVDFELFGLDGGAPGNALERVRYRLEAGEIFSMPVDTVFAAAGARGWIRVSSDLSGLTAELVSGDAISNLEVIPSARLLSDQIVVMPPGNVPVAGRLRIVNPSSQRVSVNVMVFDGQGAAVRTLSMTVEAQAAFDSDLAALASSPQVLAARISASGPVLAQAALGAGPSLIFVNGRSVTEDVGALWIAPHVVSNNRFNSTLILSNPTGRGITVFATLFSESGGPVVHTSRAVLRRRALHIAPNGTVSIGGNGAHRVPHRSSGQRLDPGGVAQHPSRRDVGCCGRRSADGLSSPASGSNGLDLCGRGGHRRRSRGTGPDQPRRHGHERRDPRSGP